MDSDHHPHHRGIMSASKLMLDNFTDFVKKRRSPSLKNKPIRDEERKTSAPAGLGQVLPLVGIIPTPGTSSQEVRLHPDFTPKPTDVMGTTSSRKPSTAVTPMVRVQYDTGRNLLNKKEAGPPSTIKESSESSQTLDDNESEKGGGQLKHENTVVRADGGSGSGTKTTTLQNSSGHPGVRNEILRVTQLLLDSISGKDYATYSRLCDPGMTFFGPEAGGYLVEGIDFHRFQFDSHAQLNNSAAGSGRVHTTILCPHVVTMGDDGASIAYILLTQYVDKNGEPRTRQSQETRVWQRKNGRWLCAHVHRSGCNEAL